MNLDVIPKLVINLESRPDRLTQVKKELSGWNAYVMPGILHPNPMIGIAKAHLNCIQYAKDKGWDSVLIMEDDVLLGKGCAEFLNEALKFTPKDWDILLGGVYEENQVTSFNEWWDKSGEFCGLHFYIVNSKAYNKILEYDYKIHIDRWINYRGQRLNTYITKKYIAIQRDGYSNNVNANTTYNDKLNQSKLL